MSTIGLEEAKKVQMPSPLATDEVHAAPEMVSYPIRL